MRAYGEVSALRMLRELLESEFGKLSEGVGKHFQNVLKV
jgi:hypothetical protein